MDCVIIESPYAGDVELNVEYAKACMLDSLVRGEAPYLSHLLYTQVVDDTVPKERTLGIYAGFAWRPKADKTIVYTDLGISPGMELGIDDAKKHGHEIVYRSLSAYANNG